ncbi:hypothetical protein NL676_018772 [Syzygium grande]|nr:hypothetical protein NL676_018772 [Syzygium grande]
MLTPMMGCLKHASLFFGVHTLSEDLDDSVSFDAAGDLHQWTGMATSFWLFAKLMLRIKLVEVEMVKAKEALRLEAEWRHAELEGEMSRMRLQTRLQIFLTQSLKVQSA